MNAPSTLSLSVGVRYLDVNASTRNSTCSPMSARNPTKNLHVGVLLSELQYSVLTVAESPLSFSVNFLGDFIIIYQTDARIGDDVVVAVVVVAVVVVVVAVAAAAGGGLVSISSSVAVSSPDVVTAPVSSNCISSSSAGK